MKPRNINTMETPTESCAKVIRAIDFYTRKHSVSPTVRELCKLVGNKSPATMDYKLKRLKKSGFIDYVDKKARTIRILKKG